MEPDNPSYLLGYAEGSIRNIADICARKSRTKAELARDLAEVAETARLALDKTGGHRK